MSNITFSQLFEAESMNKFHIAKSSARECLENPDRLEKATFDELMFVFATKNINDNFLLLVIALEKNNELNIEIAYKVTNNLENGLNLRNPLYIFEKFINEFGLEVKIQDLTKKLILLQKINIVSDGTTNLVSVLNPNNHNYYLSQMFRVNSDKTIDCALVYALDENLYQESLKSHTVKGN